MVPASSRHRPPEAASRSRRIASPRRAPTVARVPVVALASRDRPHRAERPGQRRLVPATAAPRARFRGVRLRGRTAQRDSRNFQRMTVRRRDRVRRPFEHRPRLGIAAQTRNPSPNAAANVATAKSLPPASASSSSPSSNAAWTHRRRRRCEQPNRTVDRRDALARDELTRAPQARAALARTARRLPAPKLDLCRRGPACIGRRRPDPACNLEAERGVPPRDLHLAEVLGLPGDRTVRNGS